MNWLGCCPAVERLRIVKLLNNMQTAPEWRQIVLNIIHKINGLIDYNLIFINFRLEYKFRQQRGIYRENTTT